MKRNETWYGYRKGKYSLQNVSMKLFGKRYQETSNNESLKIKKYIRDNVK